MAKMITVPSHLEIDIRRPNGVIETVKPAGRTTLTPAQFAETKRATAAAGRGEVLCFRAVTKQIEAPAEWAALDAAERAYDASTKAIYRAMDAEYEGPAEDRTPAHKGDM